MGSLILAVRDIWREKVRFALFSLSLAIVLFASVISAGEMHRTLARKRLDSVFSEEGLRFLHADFGEETVLEIKTGNSARADSLLDALLSPGGGAGTVVNSSRFSDFSVGGRDIVFVLGKYADYMGASVDPEQHLAAYAAPGVCRDHLTGMITIGYLRIPLNEINVRNITVPETAVSWHEKEESIFVVCDSFSIVAEEYPEVFGDIISDYYLFDSFIFEDRVSDAVNELREEMYKLEGLYTVSGDYSEQGNRFRSLKMAEINLVFYLEVLLAIPAVMCVSILSGILDRREDYCIRGVYGAARYAQFMRMFLSAVLHFVLPAVIFFVMLRLNGVAESLIYLLIFCGISVTLSFFLALAAERRLFGGNGTGE